MTDIYLTKRYGALQPSSESDAEKLHSIADNETFKVSFTRPRNIGFHKKYFALLDVLYNLWEPDTTTAIAADVLKRLNWTKGDPVKNRERFRKDVAIATGHYELIVNIRGDVRAEAKSISFAKMDELEFSKLYSDTINFGLQKIATNKTQAEIENWVQQIIDFA